MKFIVSISFLLFISFTALSQNYKCKKVFFKQKKASKESTVFNEGEYKSVKTKYCSIYSNGNRTLSISFKNDAQGMKLHFLSLLLKTGGLGLKREIILGQNIRIALIFEDGTNQVIQFESSEQESTFNKAGNMANENQITLSEELLNKLKSKKIVRFEIQNPFNQLNETSIKSGEVKSKIQEKVIQFANCFSLEIE